MPFKTKTILIDGVPHKECTACHEIKPLQTSFPVINRDRGEYGHYNSRCTPCNAEYQREWRKKNPKKHLQSVKVWQKNNHDQYIKGVRLGAERRRAKKAMLPNTLTTAEWREVLSDFNNQCALSDSDDLIMEHFIPLAWGHGGTYVGNVYPLDKNLNLNKHTKNPFEWAKDEKIDAKRWEQLVQHLANKNGLSVEEFREFVYWCEANQNMSSLELWKLTKS